MLDIHNLPGANVDEKIALLLRRHWLTLLSLVLSTIFVLVLPPAVYSVLRYARPDLFEGPVFITLFVLGVSIFFLFAWLFLFQAFIDYYLDVWIVTNKRILSIEQHGLFARTVSELRLHRVQDVTAEIHGFLHTMLDYGNVYIQTAGEKERFQFEDIPHPNEVAKIILDLADEDRKEHLEEAIGELNFPDKPNAQK